MLRWLPIAIARLAGLLLQGGAGRWRVVLKTVGPASRVVNGEGCCSRSLVLSVSVSATTSSLCFCCCVVVYSATRSDGEELSAARSARTTLHERSASRPLDVMRVTTDDWLRAEK